MKKNSPYLDIENAREDEQKQVMQEIIADDLCPFCLEHFVKYNDQSDPLQAVIKKGKYWYLINNRWPYKNTAVHLLAICMDHAVDLSELNPESGKELLELMQWTQQEYSVPGGAWAMRFGDTDYSAGTVNHIHVQFIQPDLQAVAQAQKPVRLKIGKVLEKSAKA